MEFGALCLCVPVPGAELQTQVSPPPGSRSVFLGELGSLAV